MELIEFTKRINDFYEHTPAEKIDVFAYYFDITEGQNEFAVSQINNAFSDLRVAPYTNVSQYLKDNSNKAVKKRKQIKFIKTKNGYHLESHYQQVLESKWFSNEVSLIDYTVDKEHLDWKADDIPLVNSSIKKSAEFFSKMYYVLYNLENSIRAFLKRRLSSIYGHNWENELLEKVDLKKAIALRDEVNLSEMLPSRGDNILYYCMWDDYGTIMKDIVSILNNKKENDELVAHLFTMAKIRNAIAHNASTIPSDYKNEFTIFINKYIKIISKHCISARPNTLVA